MEHHLSKSGLRILLHDFAEDPSKVTLDIDAFTKALAKIDSQVKALPATAQVSDQCTWSPVIFKRADGGENYKAVDRKKRIKSGGGGQKSQIRGGRRRLML